MTFLNKPLPVGYNNGKPATNKNYQMQGYNARKHGIEREDCPYLATSTSEKYWLKGWDGAL